jgi:hypothetical protein
LQNYFRYSGGLPSKQPIQAASKAANQWFKKHGGKGVSKIKITIGESTQGSSGKMYTYTAKRIKRSLSEAERKRLKQKYPKLPHLWNPRSNSYIAHRIIIKAGVKNFYKSKPKSKSTNSRKKRKIGNSNARKYHGTRNKDEDAMVDEYLNENKQDEKKKK